MKERPNNPGLAAAFYQDSSETADAADIRKNGERVSKLDSESLQTVVNCDEQRRLCLDAKAALSVATPGDKDTIQEVGARREERLRQLEDDLKRLGCERDALYKKLLDQRAYFSRSELLDFLRSRRYAINPRNLANALAGLPLMKWRQSFVRCSRMPFDEARLHYRVFEVISRIWSRRSEQSGDPLIEFFRIELLKLSKKLVYTRQFLYENWRDLKLAIEECWKSETPHASTPFVLTSLLMRNATQQKNAAERILAERERLEG